MTSFISNLKSQSFDFLDWRKSACLTFLVHLWICVWLVLYNYWWWHCGQNMVGRLASALLTPLALVSHLGEELLRQDLCPKKVSMSPLSLNSPKDIDPTNVVAPLYYSMKLVLICSFIFARYHLMPPPSTYYFSCISFFVML